MVVERLRVWNGLARSSLVLGRAPGGLREKEPEAVKKIHDVEDLGACPRFFKELFDEGSNPWDVPWLLS